MSYTKRLSQTHLDVYEFVTNYWLEYQLSPSMKELANKFKCSTSVAKYWVERLCKAGYLRITPYKARSIRVVGMTLILPSNTPKLGEPIKK